MSDDPLEIRQISPTAIEVIWKVKNSFAADYSSGSPEFRFSGFDCIITVANRKPHFVTFSVMCRCPDASTNPRVYCKLFLESREGTLFEIPIREDTYLVSREGTLIMCKIPWSEFCRNRESLAPEGVLSVVCKLGSQDFASDRVRPSSTIKEAFMKALSKIGGSKGRKEVCFPSKEIESRFAIDQSSAPVTDDIERHGKVQTRLDYPSRMEVTWTVKDFFNLPCDLITGVASETFVLPGGYGFIGLHPYGTCEKEGTVKFSIAVMCPEREGIRNPEVDCELAALKTGDDTLHKSLPGEDEERMGFAGCLFYRHFRLSEIVDRNASLVPDGVLTLFVRLVSHKFVTEESPKPVPKEGCSSSETQAKELPPVLDESCDGEFVQALTRLTAGGDQRKVAVRVGGVVFRTHMSVLLVRAPVFAAEVHKRMKDDAEAVNMDDLCNLSAFRAFLEFVNSGKIKCFPTEAAFDLYVMADRFEMDELKKVCAKYAKKSDAKFMIFNC